MTIFLSMKNRLQIGALHEEARVVSEASVEEVAYVKQEIKDEE